MSNSLSAQLLKAGLANKKQASKAKQEQYQKQKAQKKQKGQKGAETVSESKKLAQQTQAAQTERARQLNRERLQQVEKKEVAAQVKQMIGSNKIKIGKGDIVYNFADGSKIKKIYISKEIRDQLGKGQLAIVKSKGQYQVVPAAIAHKVADRDATAVIVLNEAPPKAAEDDPYAQFPIPEDLEW